jgi:H+-transporting ATPase
MITGDQLVIAKEVAYRLGMARCILDAQKLVDPNFTEDQLADRVVKADGFAHVIPEHKYRVVELLQSKGYIVGMTGDGVNDAPALKKANVGIAVEGCTDAARSAADIVLLAEGLSTIIDGIKCSRAIFQRMRSYALYRIASTIHFLLFFFISILVYGFALPDILIIMIAVLNDAATIVISVDNVRISKKPDKWRVGQLLSLSFILGALLMLISFGHFFYAKSVYPFTDPKPNDSKDSQNSINHRIVQTIMYLQISSCPHFVIFSTRVGTWWWKSMPSWTFIIAIIGTQIVAGIICLVGPHALEAEPIGWGWTFGVLGISAVMFMLLDIVKVYTYRTWSFNLVARLWPTPANKKVIQKRAAEKEILARVNDNMKKVRKAFRVVRANNSFLTPLKNPNPKNIKI